MNCLQKGFAHILPLILVVILIGAGGWWLWKNDKLNIAVESPIPTPTHSESASEGIPDDWKTYTNIQMGFSVIIPEAEITGPVNIPNDGFQVTAQTEGSNILFIKFPNINSQTQNKFDSIEEYEPNAVSFKDLEIGGVSAKKSDIYTTQGGNQQQDVIFFHQDNIWIIQEIGQPLVSTDQFNQILSTFEFIKSEEYTNTETEKVPILNVQNWKDAKIDNISFKIPSNFTCRDLESNEDYQDCRLIYAPPAEVNGELIENKVPHRISVEEYQGGSRRKQHDPDNMLSSCNPIHKEASFGNVTALQIAINAVECQGGGGGIVAVVGDKLVTLHNLNYIENNMIRRWPVGDTIVSTFRAN